MTAAAAIAAPRPLRTACPGRCAGLCGEAGFSEAHREHRTRLLGRARSMLGDAESAEDAVQEAFVRAWRACGSFDPASGPPLVTWLYAITRNVVIDMVRARAVRPPLSRTDPADVVDQAAPGGAIDSALLRMVLLDALAEVSDEHRGIVLRTVVHDRSYADVAAELDVPVGTVKSRVFYALRGLRGKLERPDVLG
ncbi:MAG: RNA polymerase sigma factor [Pseudonocardia sp.]